MGGNQNKKEKFIDGDTIKVIMCGLDGGGKSSLAIRFLQDFFPEDIDPSIEDVYRKQVEIDDCTYILDILDVAGHDDYPPMRDGYLAGAELFVVVFSITNQRTFEEVSERIEQIQRVKDRDNIDAILIGNKTDLEDQRQVSREEAMELAEKYQIPYMETSAKTGEFVEESFFDLVRFAKGDLLISQQISLNVKKARE